MAVSQMLSVTQLSQNIATNTSKVRITLTSSQSGDSHNDNTLTGYYYIRKNGGAEESHSFTTKLPKGKTVTCFSVDVDVIHRADGTGDISVRTSLNTHISAGTVTKSKSLTLTTIPRSTIPTLSVDSMDMGSTVRISLPRASTTFTHKINYICGSAVGTIASSATEYVDWTAPLDLMTQAPNSASVACAIITTTYSEGVQIGNSQTVYMTLKVPESIKPSITNVAIQDTQGIYDKYGAYVQYKSKLKITVTAEGIQGSTIRAYQIVANDVTYTENEFETDFLIVSGSKGIKVTVTDTRDRTETAIVPITVLAYTSPTISKFTVERCDADGTPNQEGSYGKVAIIGAITPLNNKNEKSFKLEYKKSTETSWTTIQTYSDSYAVNTTRIVACDVDYIYNFRITATDDFSSSVYAADLGTSYTLIDFRATGKGIAFGKVSTRDGFECAMPMVAKSISAESINAEVVSENDISIGYLHAELASTNQTVATKVGSSSFSAWTKVSGLYMFTDSNTGFIISDKGNYSFAVDSFSDSRLKKNIKDSDVDALSKINGIEMKSYDFIDKKYGVHHDIGFIAHQLKDVIPEAVSDVPQDKEMMGYDSLYQIKDTNLIPYLVKAIQELSAKIKIIEEGNKGSQ